VLQLNNVKEGFHIMGRAEDAEEVKMLSSVSALRFGAG
jgi:hypothetical protein